MTEHLNLPDNCNAFCEVCEHGVVNMEKHVQTEDHKRSVRREPMRALERSSKYKGGDLVAAKAFILIETVVGRNRAVVTALKQIEGVKSVDTVTGPYDVIAVVEGETLNDIGDLATAKLRAIAGISRTVTCLIMD